MERRYLNEAEKSSLSHGITLVEVVCGIALSALLLSTLILAHNEHARQIHASSLKVKAINALDGYLSLVVQNEELLPPNDCKNFYFEDVQWKICIKEKGIPRKIAETNYRIVQIEVFLDDEKSTNRSQALTSVELLQPINENDEN